MKVEPGRTGTTFDPHFKVFHELMAFKVQDILLVSSLYDAFIMEEDGSIAMRIIHEYRGLNLSKAPHITRVSSAEEAIQAVKSKYYDMVITMPYLGNMNAYDLAVELKKHQENIPVILVAHNLRTTFLEKQQEVIDNSFLWCCEADFLLALIKNVEDHRNVDADTQRAMVRVIIYVEDSPYYRSFFLPLIYNEVVHQTQSVLDESLNERHRLLRMRARPKILMATSFEEAMELYEKYKPYVFGIISDARFPRGGMIDARAGISFLKNVRDDINDLPMLLLSSERENQKKAEGIPAVFIDKNSTTIKEELHQFFLSYLGFGDFVFRMPDETVISHASNIHHFEQEIQQIPEESLNYHVMRNHFSNWVMARAEVSLAKELHRDTISKITPRKKIRESILEKINSLRKRRQKGVVVKFAAEEYDPSVTDFVKIGNGSLGGKARGLAFMWAALQKVSNKDSIFFKANVTIPVTCVITSDGFDTFIHDNELNRLKPGSDEKIADIFLDAVLPSWLRHDLADFLRKCSFPLSIRSSSLLEDAHYRPYAGLYSTYFLTNNHPSFEERLSQLEGAVKLVYASTWFAGPKAFARTSQQGRGEDAMAVIIQQVTGAQHGNYWYPPVSGVAQSHNYYPILNMQADEGIAHIALGLGKTVVEGEKSLRFSPARPKRLIQFSTVDDILENCQRQFYALSMKRSACLNRDMSNLVKRDVQEAASELPIKLLSSTYIPEENRIRDSDLPGIKVMGFASLLKYNMYPLSEVLVEMLNLGKQGMGCEVEIEFALDLKENMKEPVFHFLQIRPMVTGGEREDVLIYDDEISNAFCFSRNSLGHGRFRNMTDIIYVHPDRFDTAKTKEIAAEIGTLNSKLALKESKYLLVGPGRWGSADRWLGIPVQWNDISGVGAIIEVCSQAVRAEPSQGSHFFQNITSLGIPYITAVESAKNSMDRTKGEVREYEFMDWSWFTSKDTVWEGEYIAHIKLKEPFNLKCNGKTSEAVLSEIQATAKLQCEKELW